MCWRFRLERFSHECFHSLLTAIVGEEWASSVNTIEKFFELKKCYVWLTWPFFLPTSCLTYIYSNTNTHESLPVIDEFNYPAIWRQRFLFSSSSVIFRKKLTATTTTTFINKYPSSTDHFLFAGCHYITQVKTLPIRFFTREKRKKKIKTVRNATIAAVGFGFVSTIRATCCCICTF